MARSKRPVLTKDGKLQFRLAVAYTKDHVGGTIVSLFMLSVYLRCYERVTCTKPEHDEHTEWVMVERTWEPRSTPENEQLQLLNALAYKAALRLDRDFTVLVEALPKKPRRVT